MDVLRPPIIRIGGRCYRKNPIEKKADGTYEEEDDAQISADDTYSDEDCDTFTSNVEQNEEGYHLSIDVPSAYFKYIIGKKGETKKRIEYETRTQIQIPRQGMEGDIVILCRDKKGVLSAKTRIDILLASARQREPFTHFLSIPINDPAIRDRFLEFKDDVLRFCDGDRGIDSTIFQNPNKLHLTLGTMPLLNDSEISKASTLLHECLEDLVKPVLQNQPLMCQVQGLEYMNDDPGEVDVLYAKVELQDSSDRLQILANRLVDRFTSAGLMHRENERVKLHITVMNTLMRKDPSGTTPVSRPGFGRGYQKERESFDARTVLKLYRDYKFGPFHIDCVHLSQRFSSGCGGYYSCDSKLVLP